MASWAFGLLLIAVGLAWVALRATVGKKVREGSWWSQFILELSVIDRIPVVGLVWRLLPLLLIVGGVLWIMGFRPPGIPKPPPDRSPLCADDDSRPTDIAEELWSDYECRDQAQAGALWDQCLSRRAYTRNPRRGCPGSQRCCPPASAQPPASDSEPEPEPEPDSAPEQPE